MRHLPRSVQELAEVLGRERALYLVGQLKCCYVKDNRYNSRPNSRGARRSILYVPKALRPDHELVRILGWHDAERLVRHFGGEILCPPTLLDVVYRPFRDAAIVQLHTRQRVPIPMLAEWFGMSERRVQQVVSEIPKEAHGRAANDNRAPSADGVFA